ncbi:hypothetical protein M3J09_004616 [Ascochyta lentis]
MVVLDSCSARFPRNIQPQSSQTKAQRRAMGARLLVVRAALLLERFETRFARRSLIERQEQNTRGKTKALNIEHLLYSPSDPPPFTTATARPSRGPGRLFVRPLSDPARTADLHPSIEPHDRNHTDVQQRPHPVTTTEKVVRLRAKDNDCRRDIVPYGPTIPRGSNSSARDAQTR